LVTTNRRPKGVRLNIVLNIYIEFVWLFEGNQGLLSKYGVLWKEKLFSKANHWMG
jgi:hypothetical protein